MLTICTVSTYIEMNSIQHPQSPTMMKMIITSFLDPILQTPNFPLLASLLLSLLVILWKRYSKGSTLKSPPGPWKLPIIGNLHQLAFSGPLPHHTLRNLANKHGPIMHLQLGQLDAIIISSAKSAQEILKTHELTFAQRPQVLAAEVMSFGQASIAFAPYGDLWRELRKICVLDLLSAKRVHSFRSVREEEVRSLVESIGVGSGAAVINFSDLCCSTFTNDVVSRAAFGKKCKDQKEFLKLLDDTIKISGGFDIPDLFPSLRFLGFVTGTIPAMKHMQGKLGNILQDIIDDHKMKNIGEGEGEEAEEDFLDLLLKLQGSNNKLASNNLTTDQIKDVIMDIFSAGSATSSTTIEWAMSEMMRNPRVMKKAQAEVRQVVLDAKKPRVEEEDVQKMHYLKSVVKETLRLHSPAPLLPREARDTCQINGYGLPLKSKVIINQWAIGRDPESWGVDAEEFKPERFDGSSVDYKGFDFEFIPFGAGRRICPGISFGITMIELALAELLYHFQWELADGIKPDQLDMTESFGLACKRKNDLFLIATPHFASLDHSF